MRKYLDGRPMDDVAIARIRKFEAEALEMDSRGYLLAFSGGKDSIVILDLAKRARVAFEPVYNVTTIDPPDVICFMRKYHPEVRFDRPKVSLLKKLETKGFPRRQGKWCCAHYKERSGAGRLILTGIRWAESIRRRSRQMVEACFEDKTKRFLHAIIDWSDEHVWIYIRERGLPYCKLYDEGWKRIGCIFCPNSSPQEKAECMTRYPRYEALFRRAFRRLYANRKASGAKSVDRWADGDAMFDWWIRDDHGRKADIGPMFA